MSKTQHQGICRGCSTVQDVHEVGNVDPDLHTDSPEAAYLVDYHNHGQECCVGVDLSPVRLYTPQGGGEVPEQEKTTHFEVNRDGEYAGADDDDGYDASDPQSS